MSRLRRSSLLTALIALLVAAACSTAYGAAGDLDLVSWPGEPQLSSYEGASAGNPSISDDGRLVVYTLNYTLDTPGWCCVSARDVVVRDMTTGDVDVVSRADGEDGEIGDGDSYNAKISGNGRYVVFESDSTNLLGPDHPIEDAIGVYRRDLQTGATEVVRASYWGSTDPDVSDDGRYVAYSQFLYSGDSSTYVTDMNTHDTVTASISNHPGPDDDPIDSYFPRISGDGSTAAFFSFAALDANHSGGTYVWNRATNSTELVSLRDGDLGEPFPSVAARSSSLSTDGRTVAFGAYPSGQVDDGTYPNSQVYARNRDTHQTLLVSRPTGADSPAYEHGGMNPSISGDGRYVAFDIDSADVRSRPVGEWRRTVMVRDTVANTTTEVSVNSSPDALDPDGNSEQQALSADGMYAVFSSSAETLSEDDGSPWTDVFRKDLLGGSADSVTGPTAPGPPLPIDDPPAEDPDTPSDPGHGSSPPPPPTTTLTTGLQIAGERSHRLSRTFSVKTSCSPRPCTGSTIQPSLRIAGGRGGLISLTATKVLAPGFTKFTFRLSLKQYKQAARALKRRKRVTAELLFAAQATGRTATRLPVSIKLTR